MKLSQGDRAEPTGAVLSLRRFFVIKNPGAGRTSAPRDDPQVWREEHEQITIRVDPDLLAAISERQSMAFVKQPRRTFVGQRQAEAFIAPAKPAPDENMKQITIRV